MNGIWRQRHRMALAMAMIGVVTTGLRAAPAEVVWTRSAEGCLVLNPQPRVNDGVQWSGPCPAGKAQGQGTLRWLRGATLWSTYTGEVKDGLPDGEGSTTWASGNQLRGRYRQELPSGPGRFTWASGSTYEGDFAQGLPNGKGRFDWAAGGHYVGDFVNGFPQGRGVKTDAEGSTYSGDFVNGKREGRGEWVSRWGARYVGEFRNDLYHGQGAMHASQGFLLEGQWVAGRLEGPGKARFINGDEYSGGFAAGLLSGEGDYRWSNGDRYVGRFEANQPSGTGRYRFASGAEYVGEFGGGRPRGAGTLTMPDGRRISGSFEMTSATPQAYRVGAEVVTLEFSSIESPPPRPVRIVKTAKQFCTRMGKPEVPPVNWVGSADLRVVAEVKDGRVAVLELQAMLTPPNPLVESRFAAAVRKAVTETYECEGNHVFEQRFSFAIQ